MILNALAESDDYQLDADVVVVGAGPAGLTLAAQLSTMCTVLVVEAGGYEANSITDDTLRGNISGIAYPLAETRGRQWGGSSALWAGYCTPFDEFDFTDRPWVTTRWPIDKGELTKYYPLTASLLGIGSPSFDSKPSTDASAKTSLIRSHKQLMTSTWRFAENPVNFGDVYQASLENSSKCKVILNACVTEIRLAPNHSQVSELITQSVSGTKGKLRAKIFVLACGGIETPRLLLASNQQIRCGVGNQADFVGRCFMEHPHVTIAGVEMSRSVDPRGWVSQRPDIDHTSILGCIGLDTSVATKNQLLNSRGHLFLTPSMAHNEAPKFGFFSEQAPNPLSRVTLTDSYDPFGMPRIDLNWQLSEQDRTSHEVTARIFSTALIELGILKQTGPVSCEQDILYSNHQLGTTRISEDSTTGVVNEHCQVHNHPNLYVAGGSVFPTVSWANPTFTVIALTLRLADHLQGIIENDFIQAQPT